MKFHSLQRRLVVLFVVWVLALCVLATFAVHFFPRDSTWAWRLHYAMPIGAGVVFMVEPHSDPNHSAAMKKLFVLFAATLLLAQLSFSQDPFAERSDAPSRLPKVQFAAGATLSEIVQALEAMAAFKRQHGGAFGQIILSRQRGATNQS